MKKIERLKIRSLSKEKQKQVIGGNVGSHCTPNETCVAAFDGYVIGYYKRN